MNVERLQAVKAAILAEPCSIDMNVWECRSACCIGGHAERMFTGRLAAFFCLRPHAGKLLGLSPAGADALFYGHDPHRGDRPSWPVELRTRLDVAPPRTAEYAQVVADAIDDFIATNGWGLEPAEGGAA